MRTRQSQRNKTWAALAACLLLAASGLQAGTAYFDSVVVSNQFSQENAALTNSFAGDVFIARGLVVSSTLAIARQGDIGMGPYTNGQPASGMSGALPQGTEGALMVFAGGQWIAATNVSPELILAVSNLAATASATASAAAPATYAAAVSNLAQTAYSIATQYVVTNATTISTSTVPTSAAVSNYVAALGYINSSAPFIATGATNYFAFVERTSMAPLPVNVQTGINWIIETDPGNCFDITNDYYLCPLTGWYRVSGCFSTTGSTASVYIDMLALKDGVAIARGTSYGPSDILLYTQTTLAPFIFWATNGATISFAARANPSNRSINNIRAWGLIEVMP